MSRRKLPRKVTVKRLRDLLREERERILQHTAPRRGVRRLSTNALRAFVLNEISDDRSRMQKRIDALRAAGKISDDEAEAIEDNLMTAQAGEISFGDVEGDLARYERGAGREKLKPLQLDPSKLRALESRVRTVDANELQFIIHSALRGE
jgi:polyhydroxyalkanoate synthesis regulator phasin